MLFHFQPCLWRLANMIVLEYALNINADRYNYFFQTYPCCWLFFRPQVRHLHQEPPSPLSNWSKSNWFRLHCNSQHLIRISFNWNKQGPPSDDQKLNHNYMHLKKPAKSANLNHYSLLPMLLTEIDWSGEGFSRLDVVGGGFLEIRIWFSGFWNCGRGVQVVKVEVGVDKPGAKFRW